MGREGGVEEGMSLFNGGLAGDKGCKLTAWIVPEDPEGGAYIVWEERGKGGKHPSYNLGARVVYNEMFEP